MEIAATRSTKSACADWDETVMLPAPYQQLNEVLDELISRLEHILNDYFIGAYLQGSFAVGDFDEHSDADFIVVLEEEIYEVLMS